MGKLANIGYNVIVVDAELMEFGVGAFLQNMCNQLFVFTKRELMDLGKKENWFSEFMKTVSHEDVLYVTRNQANIHKMNYIYENVACCFVHDKANDYVEVDIQHEIPHVMELTRVKRTTKRL